MWEQAYNKNEYVDFCGTKGGGDKKLHGVTAFDPKLGWVKEDDNKEVFAGDFLDGASGPYGGGNGYHTNLSAQVQALREEVRLLKEEIRALKSPTFPSNPQTLEALDQSGQFWN